ncbi:BREX system P-loop protein BrxC [Candidatus Atribacteria bacterium HGW-Atribacteria-1]|nr:MAG: BREX system P-loop protein BrxC [Candidatus Atribacteria bacterium HGW-Atribacteria-1]
MEKYMKIKDLFKKDIFRSINGVIKAEQRDSESIRQELEEFVVTRELSGHFDKFFSRYIDTLESEDISYKSENMAVWVWGFFGSGKSHFIKALYYLFSKQQIASDGKIKDAVKVFEEKITDAMLMGTIKRAVSKDADVILFNIESKADQAKGREGYSPDHPHIAHMERYLDRQGKYDQFCLEYKKLNGTEWKEHRIAYQFNQDEIIDTLSEVLGQSKDACHRLMDHAETDFALTVENFSKWTKEYLDKKGPDHRIFFFVDEIGQFIGEDGHLMLSLQTIVENLGVTCEGRAWIIVTSQEDIDKVLGSLSNARTNDFSKIQGRFKTRISLSSANTDEVIQTRILEKNDNIKKELKQLYKPYADILKSQLSFSHIGMTLESFKSDDDFVKNYPFIPYQFKLLQKIFETIRRVGATGLHLSRGERSMLDAFQYATQIVSEKELGVLVPLYYFYPSIKGFLSDQVRRSILQAKDNPSLKDFDIFILQTLFMIRYIDEIKGTIDNLVTLCIDHINADRLAIKKEMEESLIRLEKETLIAHSGDHYYFLTNEEQDISREIKNVELEFGAETRLLGSIIFDDINKQNKKHRYTKTSKDFEYNRLCDRHSVGGHIEGGLTISVISPFCEDYEVFNKEHCLLESINDNGYILIKLLENEKIIQEIREYIKTEKYIQRKNDGNPEVRRILEDRKSENRARKKRIISMVNEMLQKAEFYIAGQLFDPETQDPYSSFFKSFDYLIDNTFSKMHYIQHPVGNPQAEIQTLLRRDDLADMTFDFSIPDNNPDAISEIKEYISLYYGQSRQIVMGDLVNYRFANRPYGWNEWQTVLLLTKLVISGDIHLVVNNTILERSRIYEIISKTSNWKKITIRQREKTDPAKIEAVRKLGQMLFAEMGSDKEDVLADFLKLKLDQWQKDLLKYKSLADTGKYPGRDIIKEGEILISQILASRDSHSLIIRIIEREKDLKDFSEYYQDLSAFYMTQRSTWDELKESKAKFEINRYDLEQDETIKKALIRMDEIINASAPYALIKEVSDLIACVNKANNVLLLKNREALNSVGKRYLEEFDREAKIMKVSEKEQELSKSRLQNLLDRAREEKSVANLKRYGEEVQNILDEEFARLKGFMQEETGKIAKETESINASAYTKKTFIETEEDVEEFISSLKNKLNEIIKEGKRIRIK